MDTPVFKKFRRYFKRLLDALLARPDRAEERRQLIEEICAHNRELQESIVVANCEIRRLQTRIGQLEQENDYWTQRRSRNLRGVSNVRK